jgi:hypothetical protein
MTNDTTPVTTPASNCSHGGLQVFTPTAKSGDTTPGPVTTATTTMNERTNDGEDEDGSNDMDHGTTKQH